MKSIGERDREGRVRLFYRPEPVFEDL